MRSASTSRPSNKPSAFFCIPTPWLLIPLQGTGLYFDTFFSSAPLSIGSEVGVILRLVNLFLKVRDQNVKDNSIILFLLL